MVNGIEEADDKWLTKPNDACISIKLLNDYRKLCGHSVTKVIYFLYTS